jgi:capsular polysaccharide export protein
VVYNEYAKSIVSACGFPVVKRPHRRKFFVSKEEFERLSLFCKRDVLFTKNGRRSSFWFWYFVGRALCAETWLGTFFDRETPDVIVMWNGVHFFERVAANLAKKRNIKTIFIENGYFPGTAHIDPAGTNADAEVNSLNESWWECIDENTAKEFVDTQVRSLIALPRGRPQNNYLKIKFSFRMRLNILMKTLIYDVPFNWLEIACKYSVYRKNSKLRRKDGDYCTNELPARFVFFPLQVANDSQIQEHSPWITSPQQAIREVYEALMHMDPHMALVVKEHPAESVTVDYSAVRCEFPDIVWVKGVELSELIKKSSAVVNINSSVGLQALLFGVPVLCLGRALYARKGLAYSCLDKGQLRENLDLALKRGVLPYQGSKFLYFLYLRYCAQFNRKTVSEADIKSVVEKILYFVAE